MLGASEYYYFFSGDIGKPITGEERRDYDLSTGANIKLRLGISNPAMGTFVLSYIFNGLHTFAGSVPEDGSAGFTSIGILALSYEHMITPMYSLGLSNTLYHKISIYNNSDNVTQGTIYFSLYFKIKYK